MSQISTHILDVSRGRPAADVTVLLERKDHDGNWHRLGTERTDSNGRISTFRGTGELAAGVHRLRFEVAPYFHTLSVATFYPFIEIVFEVIHPDEHHHVPLLLSSFGYSTYRGS